MLMAGVPKKFLSKKEVAMIEIDCVNSERALIIGPEADGAYSL